MSRKFIILEADPLVRMDLEEMLSAAFPDASVQMADRAKSGAALIAETGKGGVIFLRSVVAQTVGEIADGLAKAHERGAMVYLLGDPISVSFEGQFIDLPFSQDSLVTQLLRDLI